MHGACRFAEESDAAFGTSVLPMGIYPTICDVLASLVDGFREEVVWTKSNDLKVHKMAVEKLVHEFDLSPGDFRNFMTEVETRSDAVGFNNLYSIDVTRTNAAGTTTTVKKDLIKEYGQIKIDDVCNSAAITLNSDGRKAQLEAMLYTCLNQSLSKGAQKRMALKRQYFETAGRKSGTCYLKIIMMETQQDTNATSKYLRDNLREMDHYIVKIDSDIIKFNDYVDEQIEGLTARGETTRNLTHKV